MAFNPLKRLRETSGLLGRLLRGGVWLGAGSAAEQGLRFVRNMILARLLAPEAFGLMAIVLSTCSLLQVLTGIGIKEAVVQSPRGTHRTYLNGAWWLAVTRGLVIYIVAVGAAPWIADFYAAPELKPLLRVAFLGVVAQGALSVGAYVAVKQMQYPRWVLVQHGGSALGILTTVVLALWLQGVWALVIGYAAEGFARCLLSHLVCPFRPSRDFCREDLRRLFRFAAGMFGLPVLMMIYTDGAVFAVGKLCTKEELGIFALALTLARIPSMFSNQVVELLMPAFSGLQADRARTNQGILKVTTLVVLLGLPAACFVAFYAREIMVVAYGPAYTSGGVLLSILFCNELLLVCSVPIATVYLALGKPALLRLFSLFRAVLVGLLIWPLISGWNIIGAAVCPLLAMLGAFGFQLRQLHLITQFEVRSYLGVWLRGGLVTLPCCLLCVLVSQGVRDLQPLVSLTLAATALGFVTLSAGLVLGRRSSLRKYFWPFAVGKA